MHQENMSKFAKTYPVNPNRMSIAAVNEFVTNTRNIQKIEISFTFQSRSEGTNLTTYANVFRNHSQIEKLKVFTGL